MPLAVVLIVLVVGSLVFHFLSPWTFTPIASNWGMIDSTVDITVIVTGIVFVAVNLYIRPTPRSSAGTLIALASRRPCP